MNQYMSKQDHYLKIELDKIVKNNPEILYFFESGFNDGLWFWDLENPEHEWMSPRFWELLGIDPSTKEHRASEWQHLIFPEDLETALNNFHKHCADEKHPYDQVVRYHHSNGSTVWVQCRGLAIRDENGTPIRLLGAHTDITALKNAQLKAAASEAKFRAFIEYTDDLITQVDSQGNFTYLSPSCRKYYGLPPEDCIGLSAFQFIHPDDRQNTQEAFALWEKDKSNSFSHINRQLHINGQSFTMLWTISVIRGEKGEVQSFNSIARDVTEDQQRKTKLARNGALLSEVGKLADVGGWELDLKTGSIYWTDQVYKIHELPKETPLELLSVLEFYSPESKEKLEKAIAQLVDQGIEYDLELELTTAKGNHIWVRTKGRGVYENKKVIRLTGSIQNISERKKIENDLNNAKALLEQKFAETSQQLSRETDEKQAALYELKLAGEVFKNSFEGIAITDVNAVIVDINNAFSQITGYSREEALGQHTRMLKSDRHDEAFYKTMWNALLINGAWEGEIWNRRKSGEAYIQRLSISAVTDSLGATTHYVAVFRDITKLKASEEQIIFQAHHDALTKLPNRTLLRDRLTASFARAQRANSKAALLFLDLDDFKKVNDSLGHIYGDRLLQECARRLQAIVREEDTVARMGGDEFLILLENIRDIQEVTSFAQRAIDALAKSFHIAEDDVFITSSIGIALSPEDGMDPDILIRNADMAMYRAKNSGKNSYRLFTESMHQEVRKRLSLESSLRKAIDNDEMVLHYQPKIRTHSKEICGLEALVRWKKPDGQMVPPNEFIPLAEHVGLIIPLGKQILKKACAFTKELQDEGFHSLQMAVNLSLKQFQQPQLVRTVLDTVAQAGIQTSNLEFEITESAIMEDIKKTIAQLSKLSEAGITLSIDDFGTGHSSLSHLKELPIDVLKIDRSFIKGIPQNPKDVKIVKAIQSLAKSFEVKTVAEGVEQQNQYLHLQSIGCDAIQGYFFSPPIPSTELLSFLKNTNNLFL